MIQRVTHAVADRRNLRTPANRGHNIALKVGSEVSWQYWYYCLQENSWRGVVTSFRHRIIESSNEAEMPRSSLDLGDVAAITAQAPPAMESVEQ